MLRVHSNPVSVFNMTFHRQMHNLKIIYHRKMYSATLKFGLNKLKINKFDRFVDGARRLYTTQAPYQPEDEYTSEPQYPEVLDLSLKARKAREKIAWHEEVKKVTTVEGKLLKINMPRYWGYNTSAFDDDFHRYNCLQYYRHWTRTNFKEGIPSDYYRSTAEEENALIGELRGLIENAVAMEVTGYRLVHHHHVNLTSTLIGIYFIVLTEMV